MSLSVYIYFDFIDLKVLEELPGTLARLERDVAALRKAVEGDRKMLEVSCIY